MITSDYKWSFLGSTALATTQLLSMILAARMLQPAELGLWAILLMMYRLLTPFVEGGWNRAVIREKLLNDTQINTLFSLNVILGLLASTILCFSADIIAGFFYVGDLNKYILAFSSIFIAIGLGSLRGSLLQKEMHFEKMAKIQILASLSEFTLFLFLIFKGYRVWALLFPFVLRFYIQHLSYLLLCGLRIQFEFDFKSVRSIFDFSFYDLGSQLLNYFYTNIDNILVGRLLGQTALGFYALAWDITVKPVSFFNPVILRVAFPKMSKATQVKAIYNETLKKVAAVQIPLYILLGSFMFPIISTVYGQQWIPAANVAIILCGVAVLRALAEPGASVLAVKGRIDFEFYFQFLNIIVTCLSIFLFFYLDPEIKSIGWAMLAAHLVLMGFWFWWISNKLIQTEIQ